MMQRDEVVPGNHSGGEPRTILTVSGSLRARSTNTELLKALALLAPSHLTVLAYDGLVRLPLFNPDLDVEGATPPIEVTLLRQAIAACDALVISSPEYAHGVPGALKNGLDWLVSGPDMPFKPTGLLPARSIYAHASLAETLRTMSATLVDEAVTTIPLDGRRWTASEIASDCELAAMLGRVLTALDRAMAADQLRRQEWNLAEGERSA